MMKIIDGYEDSLDIVVRCVIDGTFVDMTVLTAMGFELIRNMLEENDPDELRSDTESVTLSRRNVLGADLAWEDVKASVHPVEIPISFRTVRGDNGALYVRRAAEYWAYYATHPDAKPTFQKGVKIQPFGSGMDDFNKMIGDNEFDKQFQEQYMSTTEDIVNLLYVCNYMHSTPLLLLASAKMSRIINGKRAEEIREMFGFAKEEKFEPRVPEIKKVMRWAIESDTL